MLVDEEMPDSFGLLVRAASLVVGADLVACHSTAARLWGFDVLGDRVLHVVGPPELVNRRRHGIQVHPSSLGCDDAVLAVEGRARWVDVGWREQRVGAELDGQEAHMTPEQLRDDRRRHNWLTGNGWTLLHFTGHDGYRAHRQMLAVTARALGLPPGSWRS